MPAENIFAAYAQPVRSMADYADELDQRELRGLQLQGQQRQNAIADLTARQTQDTLRQGGLEREALRAAAAQAGGDPKALIQRLRTSGMPGLMTQADALEKGLIERMKGEAAAGKDTAETEKVRQSMQKAALMDHIQTLGGLSDPGQVTEYLSQANDIPEMRRNALLQSLQSVRSLPELQQWQARAVLTLAAPEQQAKAMQPDYKDAGGSMVNTNTLAAGAAPIPITQSENNKATVGASMANAAALREQANATRDAAKITARAGDETALRKEFADLPEVKKFKNAIPAYQAIVQASKTNNPQADINLIYGLAKLYDPDSVVREGEYDTIANSQSIPEWLKGQAQRLMGGGKLTAETKKQILEQAGIRIKAYENEVKGAQASYDGIAKGRSLNGANVFPAIGGQMDGAKSDAAAILQQADAILRGGK